MFYLAWQTLLWIIFALLSGILIGSLFRKRRPTGEADEAFGLEPKDDERDETIALLRGNLSRCERELNDFKEREKALQDDEQAAPVPTVFPEGGPLDRDDLKMIKGVGPFLEKKLNEFGVRTYRQVAELGPVSIRNLGDSFGSFEKRIIWEKWVEQAEELMKKHQTR